MNDNILSAVLHANWIPKPKYESKLKDIKGKLTYLGSLVWKNPELKLEKNRYLK